MSTSQLSLQRLLVYTLVVAAIAFGLDLQDGVGEALVVGFITFAIFGVVTLVAYAVLNRR
jgi:hypothetical protein